MKIYILYEIVDGAYGGGNQFLRALRDQLGAKGILCDNHFDADVILFNSHHRYNIYEISTARKSKDQIYVHRVDGPIFLYNKPGDQRDAEVNSLNTYAHATVFQSEWSKKKNIEMGIISGDKPSAVIPNAPDPNLFNRNYEKTSRGKTRIVMASWSDNVKKGFEYYDFIDKNLDFSRYDVTFAGRSPVRFNNIKCVGILDRKELSDTLKNSDIYLTASQNDPCSNSLLEALHCGIPAVALNSGGHPELVKDGGKLFNGFDDIVESIECVASDVELYSSRISVLSIESVAEMYSDFCHGFVTSRFLNNLEFWGRT